MTDWIVYAGFFISGAMIIMMVLGIFLSAFMPALDQWSRRYFITFFFLLSMYSVVLSIDLMIYRNPDMASAQKVIIILEYMFFSVLMPMPMILLLHHCGENLKNSILLRSAVMLWCLFCILLFATQFMDMFYYVTSDNQ